MSFDEDTSQLRSSRDKIISILFQIVIWVTIVALLLYVLFLNELIGIGFDSGNIWIKKKSWLVFSIFVWPAVLWGGFALTKAIIEEKREEDRLKQEVVDQGLDGNKKCTKFIDDFFNAQLADKYSGAQDCISKMRSDSILARIVGIWGIEVLSEQTAGKDIKDSFISGAFGLPVPVLGATTYQGKLCALVIGVKRIYYLYLATVPVDDDGTVYDIDSIYCERVGVKALSHPVEEVAISDINSKRLKFKFSNSPSDLYYPIESYLVFDKNYTDSNSLREYTNKGAIKNDDDQKENSGDLTEDDKEVACSSCGKITKKSIASRYHGRCASCGIKGR